MRVNFNLTPLTSFISSAKVPIASGYHLAIGAFATLPQAATRSGKYLYRLINTNNYTRLTFAVCLGSLTFLVYYLTRKPKALPEPEPQLESASLASLTTPAPTYFPPQALKSTETSLEDSPPLPPLPKRAPPKLPARHGSTVSSQKELAAISSPTLPHDSVPAASSPPQLMAIVAEISIWGHRSWGCIYEDRKWNFKDRLKDSNKQPFPIRPTDQYILLWHAYQIPPVKDAKGDLEFFMLPSSLFDGRRSGDVVEFYLDEKFYQLTLTNHCMSDVPFEVSLAQVLSNPEAEDLFLVDMPGIPHLFGIPIQDSKAITPWSPPKINVKAILRDQWDQKYHTIVNATAIRKTPEMEKGYHVYEVYNLKGTYVFLVIPHHRVVRDLPPKEIQAQIKMTAYELKKIKPKTTRTYLEGYHHGQYLTFFLTPDIERYSIEFNKAGCLEITIFNKRPDFKESVMIATNSWPIDRDEKFQFNKRLKWADGTSISVGPTDRYILFYNTNLQLLDAKGNISDKFVLPSSMFIGCKEGATLRFFLDDKLYELTLEQGHKNGFEEVLENALKNQFCDFHYKEDIGDDTEVLCNQVIHRYRPYNKLTPGEIDFDFYEQDQVNQRYDLLTTSGDSSIHSYDFPYYDGAEKDIHIYEIQNSKGNFILAIIPHHQKAMERAKELTSPLSPGSNWYKHGKYILLHKPISIEKYDVNFQANGYLSIIPVYKS